jgi:hypothetical protein
MVFSMRINYVQLFFVNLSKKVMKKDEIFVNLSKKVILISLKKE